MNRKARIRIGLALFSCVAIAAIGYGVCLVAERKATSPEELIRETKKRAYYADMFLYEVDYHDTNRLVYQILEDEDGDTLNEKVARLAARVSDLDGITNYAGGKVQMVDAWGRPFHMTLPDDIPVDMPFDLKRNRPVVIWSSGPDATNNQGFNDDVYYPDRTGIENARLNDVTRY